MQARCRRSLIWAVAVAMVALAGWTGARSAAASGLGFMDETAPCAPAAQGMDVAALAAPEWAQETPPATGTESTPPPMGTESAPPATATESTPPPATGTAAPAAPAGGGPSCTTNKQCHDTKMYCARPNGHCKGKGECTAKPDVCPDVVAPVCGCNGKTYNNECTAHRAGVNVRHDGKCKRVKKSTKPAAAAAPKTGT